LQKVSRVVGRHEAEEPHGVRPIIGREVGDHRRRKRRLHLGKGFGGRRGVHLLEQLDGLVVSQLLERVGGVRGVLEFDRARKRGHIDRVTEHLLDPLILGGWLRRVVESGLQRGFHLRTATARIEFGVVRGHGRSVAHRPSH